MIIANSNDGDGILHRLPNREGAANSESTSTGAFTFREFILAQ